MKAPARGGRVRLYTTKPVGGGEVVAGGVRAPARLQLTLLTAREPDRSGGVGGWVATQRAGRRPAKWWQGQPDDLMTWELVLDEDVLPGPPIADRLRTLYAMGRKAAGEDEPPVLRLLGDVAPQDRRTRWVLQDVALGQRLWRPGERVLRQQRLTITLEGYDDVDAIAPVRIKRTRDKKGQRRRRTIRTQRNDTLRAIAVRELGESGAWKQLVEWNKRFKDTDPDAPLRAGIEITLR